MNYQNIDSLKNKLDELRPLKKEAIINYEALDLAHVKNDYSYFLKLINEYLIESFDRYFFYL